MKNVLYELNGKSLEAAKSLERLVADEIETNPPRQTGLLSDIRADWQQLAERLVKQLSYSQPKVLDLTGLSAPCIEVKAARNAYPRAYQTFPGIYRSCERETRYFMYCPVDYKNEHFIPEDAREIKGKEISRIGDLLFAEGWDNGAPILIRPEYGVEMPKDIRYSTKFAAIIGTMENTYSRSTSMRKNFIPGGRSQELVNDFKKRKQEHEAASNAVFDELRRIAEIIYPDLKNESCGYNVRLSGSHHGENGANMTFKFSINSNWNGALAETLENPYFNVKKVDGIGDFQVIPREDTVEGAIFADLLLAVPPVPYMHDYAELISDFKFKGTDIEKALGVDGRIPQLVELGGLQFISYNSDERVVSDYCPPGAKPVSTELYTWLERDNGDKNMGVGLPPMPDQLAQEYAALTLPRTVFTPRQEPGI